LHADWARETFGTGKLGDSRRVERLERIAAQATMNPNGKVSDTFSVPAELDNNRLERSMRGPVMGRKNHYGSHSKRGTQVAAIFYSLIESAKPVGIEPKAYIRTATLPALTGQSVPLPHEVAQPLAASVSYTTRG
jgi:hypothetical protein